MNTEGEILLTEKYGSSGREVVYVKPPEQTGVVVVDRGKLVRCIYSWFGHIFLPHGYPDSVSKDYTAYQIWDTAQAFCSTVTGTLATQEVLRGVGVGKAGATPLAATATWVIKDGCGHLGRILFAYTHGTQLDAYSKKWRLYADTLNDAAMCIEIALPLFKNYTLFALCVSTTMKAIVGVAGGATRAAMTQHHAVRGNMADVAAKDSAQETAVNLIASFAALFLITCFGNSMLLFLLMIVLHIICNYLAVRSVCLRTLNEPRYLQVIDAYLKQEVIMAPCEINKQEPIVFYQMGSKIYDFKLSGFLIKIGCSLKNLSFKKHTSLKTIQAAYAERNYLLYPHLETREMFVLLREEATTDDILQAYLHAVVLAIIICTLNNDSLIIHKFGDNECPFAQVCRTLQAADWSLVPSGRGDCSQFPYKPTRELLKYVDQVVHKEWPRIRSGLQQTGWDLSKHLLMIDEWRVAGHAAEVVKEVSSIKIPHEKVMVDEDSDDEVPRAPSTLLSFVDLKSDRKLSDGRKEGFLIEPITEHQSEETLVGTLSKTSKQDAK